VIKVGTSSLLRTDKNCIHLSQARGRAGRGGAEVTKWARAAAAARSAAPRCARRRGLSRVGGARRLAPQQWRAAFRRRK
jgi:hypothetical protein